MRKFKFRGISCENNTMVYGVAVVRQLSSVPYDEKIAWLFMYDEGLNSENGDQWIKIWAHTVGEGSGLSDNADVDIYEADIVSYRGPHHVVENYLGSFGVIPCKEKHLMRSECFWSLRDLAEMGDLRKVTVIGNIHQHPELNY